MTSSTSDYTDVTVETLLGSKYVFPDMPVSTMNNLISRNLFVSTGRLVLVNTSAAVLSMEARIVRCISYNGEVRWQNAAVPPVHELPDSGAAE